MGHTTRLTSRRRGGLSLLAALLAVFALLAVSCGDGDDGAAPAAPPEPAPAPEAAPAAPEPADEAPAAAPEPAPAAEPAEEEVDLTQADGDAIEIWVVGSVLNNPFWDLIQNGSLAAGEALADANVTYIAPEDFSLANVNEFIVTAVAAEPDAILVDYRTAEYEEAVIDALDKGIEVQFYNNYVGKDSADPRVRRLSGTPVGLDKAAAARRSAELYLEHVSPGDQLVLFNSLPDSPEHLEIENAYVAVFTDAGWSESDLDIVALPGLDPAPNFEVIKTYLAANPGTQGIVTWDTTSGTPAAQAKADAGSDVPLVMWNLDQTVIEGVKDGNVQLSLTQQPFLQTFYGVISAYIKVKFGFIDPPVIDPGTLLVPVDKVNVVVALFEAGYAVFNAARSTVSGRAPGVRPDTHVHHTAH
ncbi:MAG: substrate-binding domain-containing protein [Acidimicrobiia bacterium]|nr:substrate-binding domain-containing protein [Acidimicrobiia bacterium]